MDTSITTEGNARCALVGLELAWRGEARVSLDLTEFSEGCELREVGDGGKDTDAGFAARSWREGALMSMVETEESGSTIEDSNWMSSNSFSSLSDHEWTTCLASSLRKESAVNSKLSSPPSEKASSTEKL